MSKTIFFLFLTLVLTLFSFVPAGAQEIRLDYAAPVDFSHFKTYTWKRAENCRYPDDATDSILRQAVDRQMALRGYRRIESDDADLYLVYHLAVLDDAEWGSFNTAGQWYGGGVNSVAVFTGGTTNTTTFIKVGWLILDLFDVKGQKQVWQVSAKKTLGDGKDPKKMQKNAEKAMTKIFQQFPVRAS